MSEGELIPLGFMNPGDCGTIEEVRGHRHHRLEGHEHAGPSKGYRRGHLYHLDKGHRIEHRLQQMGLRPGERVRAVSNSPRGPVIVAVKDTRICLGRGIALRVMVRPEDSRGNTSCPADGEG